MDAFSKAILSGILLVLCILLVFRVQEYAQQTRMRSELAKSISELETKRLAIFKEYLEDLASYETKSVYHQIYHASNAQLKMLDLVAQENELLMTMLSGSD